MNRELNKGENEKESKVGGMCMEKEKERRACRNENSVNRNMYRNELDR